MVRSKFVNFPKEIRIRDMPAQEFVDLSEHKLWEYVKKVGTTDMKKVCETPFKGATGVTEESAMHFRDQLYDKFDYNPSRGGDSKDLEVDFY